MSTDTTTARPGRRLLARVLAPLLAALALLLLPGPGLGGATADAVSVCHGRPTRTIAFATGELRLYKTRHYACAVTVAKRPGALRPMSVSLQPRGGRPAVQAGRFGRQAGPVTVHALNRCVRAVASVAGRGTTTGWILC
ncbi:MULTISPECIES: hypothetical protein [unclassified Streptomyces]|uniref:hypothetical protein n=1 Tax=unclassified Streptomyces TaxID=2593676 RepID=UPI0006FBDE73|nr:MULTISPECIES: hypothetical protein [unclassified Streptomyces]KQX52828.1 hypothetical protein ASD33_06115 [Streptomyces sp. Root1304]KRA89743.1 hypothetical protein ASE09_06120 [Streptomyces sp. Root66D1]